MEYFFQIEALQNNVYVPDAKYSTIKKTMGGYHGYIGSSFVVNAIDDL